MMEYPQNRPPVFSVSDGTHSTSYYYDSANQLVRENNQAGNLTKGWTYDNAGNILQSREYAYATGEVVDRLETNNYTYGDSNWGDKLTAYNGKNITYDAIGNPLSDGTWNYTWEHGREMASMSNNSALVITQQPQDCEASLGGTATFTVSASGTGLSCRWQFSSDAGKTWHNSTNSTAIYGTIQITGLTQDLMNLLWRCIVTDGTGHTAVSQVARCKTAWCSCYNHRRSKLRSSNWGKPNKLYNQTNELDIWSGQHSIYTKPICNITRQRANIDMRYEVYYEDSDKKNHF